MRDAPSREIMEAFWQAGARVRAFDPEAMRECRRIYGERDDLALVDSREAALEGADALVIATEWKVFQAPDFDLVKKALKVPVIFDGRNLYEPQTVAAHGISYFGIGRSSASALMGMTDAADDARQAIPEAAELADGHESSHAGRADIG